MCSLPPWHRFTTSDLGLTPVEGKEAELGRWRSRFAIQFQWKPRPPHLESSEEGTDPSEVSWVGAGEYWDFISPQQICGLPQEAAVALCKAAIFGRVSSEGRWQYKWNSQCVITLLTCFFPSIFLWWKLCGAQHHRSFLWVISSIKVSNQQTTRITFSCSWGKWLLYDRTSIRKLTGKIKNKIFKHV